VGCGADANRSEYYGECKLLEEAKVDLKMKKKKISPNEENADMTKRSGGNPNE